MGKMFVSMSRAPEIKGGGAGGTMTLGPINFREPMNLTGPINSDDFFWKTHQNPEKIVAVFSEGLFFILFWRTHQTPKVPNI